MTFFDMNSRNTFNELWTLFSPPKNTEWPKWLTLPIHYQPSFRYIIGVKPIRDNYGLEYFQCELNCGHIMNIHSIEFHKLPQITSIKISCKECGGTGEIK